MGTQFAVGELLVIHFIAKFKSGNLFFIFKQKASTSVIKEIFFEAEQNKRWKSKWTTPVTCFDCYKIAFLNEIDIFVNTLSTSASFLIIINIAKMLKVLIISKPDSSTKCAFENSFSIY